MAESLLLPVVRGVLGKAADALVQKVTAMWGLDDHRRELELKLLYVQPLLADAEAKAEADTEAGRAVRAWMRELRSAAYQADDVLDDFHRDLKNVLSKIDRLVKDMEKFGLLQREQPETLQPLYRQTHSAMDEFTEIFGRDDDKEVVVKLLLDQQNQRNVQVLPIIGMGGLGKTTLAKMVYNDRKVQNHFELRMWHCVSENFGATAVVRSIIELATNGRCDLPDNIELLRGKLQEVIGRKRFLLILDDVWNEEQQKWEDDLKQLLCSSIGGLGSMIVVTSRSRRVASIMGTLPAHELACLSDHDSWELFSKKAFSKGLEDQEEFIAIGKLIVNKCKGLPLALKTMGGLMSSKHQIKEWEVIAESNMGGNNEVLKRMPPKLGMLQNLCTLTKFVVDIGDGFGIDELKDLRQLGNRLELYNLKKVKSGSKANLHENKNLTALFLHWGRDYGYYPLHGEVISNGVEEEVLESLVPHAKLKTLELHGLNSCYDLKALPDGLDGLTSLERLDIRSCQGITKFPQDLLLQRIPALKSLRIDYCPDLQRRCREGGEYFDLVSPIPEKDILPAPEPKTNKSAKRFFTSCGGGGSSSS
nr:unnamed protein product [Digitaria exilis]